MYLDSYLTQLITILYTFSISLLLYRLFFRYKLQISTTASVIVLENFGDLLFAI